MIYETLDGRIGKTPLVRLRHMEEMFDTRAVLLAKAEYFNPTGSVKDRAALSILNDAEARGLITKGALIIEPTSGNMGIALCALARRRGYRVLIVMPENMSRERIEIVRAYGGEVVLTKAERGMAGAIERAREIQSETEGSFIPSQFENAANVRAHYETTGPEIFEDSGGAVDAFVAGVGTGGTLMGVGKFLKERREDVRIFAVEPTGSPVLSGGARGVHQIQGIGAGFVPSLVKRECIDEILTVGEREALDMQKTLARQEGIFAGISSGAALVGAVRVAKSEEYEGGRVVVLFPDTGERYLSEIGGMV